MINYKPVPFVSRSGPASEIKSAKATRFLGAPAPAPPPTIDPIFTAYEGIPGFLETAVVLLVAGAAGWVGITTGLNKKNSTLVKSAGWVGGIGTALMGLLYLGAKTGVNDYVGLPAVRVSPV